MKLPKLGTRPRGALRIATLPESADPIAGDTLKKVENPQETRDGPNPPAFALERTRCAPYGFSSYNALLHLDKQTATYTVAPSAMGIAGDRNASRSPVVLSGPYYVLACWKTHNAYKRTDRFRVGQHSIDLTGGPADSIAAPVVSLSASMRPHS